MTQAYDHLSEWFEYLNDDCDYPAWSQYFLSGLAALGAGRKGLEVGCGSGAFCRALAKAGYEMTGVDLSAPMLDKAARLAREEGVCVRFFQADAAVLPMREQFDFLLAPNDCYNYIMPEKLPAAFRKAAARLKKRRTRSFPRFPRRGWKSCASRGISAKPSGRATASTLYAADDKQNL